MADIRIKDLATTASSTASDDFLAVDGTTNGTRKLNAFSPTFGGNVVATGTLTVNSTTDSSSKDTGAIITEGGLGVEKSATIGGNLTVSGTGTSSVAGSFGVGTASPSAPLEVRGAPINPDTNVYGQVRLTNATTAYNADPRTGIYFSLRYNSSGSLTAGGVSLQSYKETSTDGDFGTGLLFTTQQNGAAPSEKMRITGSGNLLLGTTTDSANGKLQLATHTTSAGGIGFGTEFSLFRKSSDTVVLNNTGSVNVFKLAEAGTDTVYLNSVSGVGTLGTATAKSLVLATNGTTALTLDSSQNATFGGNIKTAAPSGGTAATWRLGTVASVSPTSPNRTIEVEIGGTTYYIHAKTTNN